MNCLHCGAKMDKRPKGASKVKINSVNAGEVISNMEEAIVWDCSNCCSLFIEMFDIEPRINLPNQIIPTPKY